MKTLYFEGPGRNDPEINAPIIGNCRIRTAFHLDNGQAVYLELLGSWRPRYADPKVYKWPHTGFVDTCHYITNDKPNDDENQHRVKLEEQNRVFEYTENEVLRIVNSLGASFDAIKVAPELGGYRVFPTKHVGDGPNGYYYGDEFQFDPGMIARREAVHRWVYDMELQELEKDRRIGGNRFIHSPGGRDFPNFSLWVDEFDPGLLHLLRHFIGYNKHWSIRTDAGSTLEDCLATMQETRLGNYGC